MAAQPLPVMGITKLFRRTSDIVTSENKPQWLALVALLVKPGTLTVPMQWFAMIVQKSIIVNCRAIIVKLSLLVVKLT
jgi:hypothetical protein